MRPRPAHLKTRPGLKGAGPFDSPRVAPSEVMLEMDIIPTGWEMRRSGLVVPLPNRRSRRGPAILGLVASAVMLVALVANGVSDVSRAVVDIVTSVRVVLTGDPADSPSSPFLSDGCPAPSGGAVLATSPRPTVPP